MNSAFRRPFPYVIWTLTAIYTIVLATLTHIPPQEVPKTHFSDKFEHFTAYTVLAFLFNLSLASKTSRLLRNALIAIAAAMVFGAIDELTQPWFNRQCSIYDWFADSGGATTGAIVSCLLLTLLPTKKPADGNPRAS